MTSIMIGGKEYPAAALGQVSLRDILTFKAQVAALGFDRTFHDIEEMFDLKTEEFDALPYEDRMLAYAVLVWAARRVAGEQISLGDAIDVPIEDIYWLSDVEDGDDDSGEAEAAPEGRTPTDSAPADDSPEPE